MKSCLSSEHKHDFTGKCINMNYIYDLFDKMLTREERNLLGQLYQDSRLIVEYFPTSNSNISDLAITDFNC